MGIKNLHKFLKSYLKKANKLSDVYKTMSLHEFKEKTIAIDVSIYLYKYKCAMGSSWMKSFYILIRCLALNKIKTVFIFDGIALPAKKTEHKQASEHS